MVESVRAVASSGTSTHSFVLCVELPDFLFAAVGLALILTEWSTANKYLDVVLTDAERRFSDVSR